MVQSAISAPQRRRTLRAGCARRVALEARFDGGRLTSDGGCPGWARPRRPWGCARLRGAGARMAPGAGAALPGGAGAPAGVPDRLWVRGPGRRRHPTDGSAAQAGLWPACRRAGPTWPASRPSPGWRMPRTGQRATAWRGPCWPSTCRSGAHGHPPADPAGRRRDGRSDPRAPGGHGVPWLLSPAHVPPVAGLRRRDRPPPHGGAPAGQRPRARGGGHLAAARPRATRALAGRATRSNCGRTVASPSPRSMTTATRKASPTRSA